MQTFFNKKILLVLASASFIASIFAFSIPEKSSAQFGGPVFVVSVTDPATLAFYASQQAASGVLVPSQVKQTLWDTIFKPSLDELLTTIAKTIARSIIQNITEAMVDWINSGFQGNPAFVSNTEQFLLHTGDQVVGDMLFNNSDLNFLCAPFQAQVKIALGLGYSQPFYKRISCTLTGAITNTENAINNFTRSGGWNNWLQLSQPQNNVFGAYLIAKSELDSRIASKQAGVAAELSFGQGALTYQQCVERKLDKNGNVISTNTYMGSQLIAPVQSRPAADGSYMDTNCTVKTPGAIITNMLGFKATSDVRELELQAALSNGIDQILGALANQLISRGIEQLTGGVLTNNANANLQYRNQLNSLIGQSQSNFNARTSNTSINAPFNFSSQLSGYDSLLGDGFSAGFGPTNNNQTINDPYANLAPVQSAALSRIDVLENSERSYRNNFMFASGLLTDARALFVDARNCNANYSDATRALRAMLINANVISNIDGISDPNRNLMSIAFNLQAINTSITLIDAHLLTLETARSAVLNATNTMSTAINDSMTPVNSTSYTTGSQTQLVSDIKQWLAGVRDMYSTSGCPVNLTDILNR